tara:strand:- start:197 stop:442 length:246 start_codon:yes stop_codon:yes gene_type:complete
MKRFWPNRPVTNGFSIQNLANKYRQKISRHSFHTNETSNKILDESNSKLIIKEEENISIAKVSIKRIHWANRDFSEYKKSA